MELAVPFVQIAQIRERSIVVRASSHSAGAAVVGIRVAEVLRRRAPRKLERCQCVEDPAHVGPSPHRSARLLVSWGWVGRLLKAQLLRGPVVACGLHVLHEDVLWNDEVCGRGLPTPRGRGVGG